jgi:hypothetical protein
MIHYSADRPFYDNDDFWENASHHWRMLLARLGYYHLRLVFFNVISRTVYSMFLHGKLIKDGRCYDYAFYNTELDREKLLVWRSRILDGSAAHPCGSFKLEKESEEIFDERFIVPKNDFCEFLMKRFCGLLFYKRYVMED